MLSLDNVPTTNITIQGSSFEVPMPYKEGHVLLPNEARALNQTYAENLRNNFASTVADAVAEAEKNGTAVDLEDLQTKLSEYAKSYEFNVRRVGSRTATDPITHEAEKLARAAIRVQAKKKNVDLKNVTEEQMDQMVSDALAKYPTFKEQATAIVAARKAVEDLQLG